ncbi:MAG: transcriptional repressor LexA [bacterium]
MCIIIIGGDEHAKGIKLTEKQQQVLDFCLENIQRCGYPPTVREIQSHLGLKSPCAPFAHLKSLQEKSYLRKVPTKPRAIELLVEHKRQRLEDEYVKVPKVGRIQTGLPLLALENIEGEIILGKDLVSNTKCFALKVEGNSMIEAGILSGDYVIVRRQKIADNGDIVVALVGGDATVKYYYRESTSLVRLEPANSKMEPILVSAEDIKIAGKVIGLYRRF